jgi:hypothetical protein
MEPVLRATAAALGAAALVASAGAAHASATVDLIWAETGTNELWNPDRSSAFTLQVVLTAGPNAVDGAIIIGAGVSVDYTQLVDFFSVVGFASTPGGPLPISLGTTIDTGSRIENINSAALPPYGLRAGQSHQLGTVTFHKSAIIDGYYEIRVDALGPTDGIVTADGTNITDSSTFNSALVIQADPCLCGVPIEVNTLRGGSPTVTVGETKDITAKARIRKGTAFPDRTIDTMLRIDAIDGAEIIDSQSSGPIRLEVGKGGDGDTITMKVDQCQSGSIVFEATFSEIDPDPSCERCEGTRRIAKTCK